MRTVLAIGAHPDDIEIGCGGTLALLKAKGARLIHLIATSGEEGRLGTSPEAMAKIRENEALQAANLIGADEVIFLRLQDGLTGFSKETKVDLVRIIRRYRPQTVFVHSSHDRFPDHRVVHDLTMSAVTAASGPWFPTAEGSPHRVEQVLGYEVWSPIGAYQKAVDISSAIHLKLDALKRHRSQIDVIDYVGAIEGLARYRGAMTFSGSHAEVFEVLTQQGDA